MPSRYSLSVISATSRSRVGLLDIRFGLQVTDFLGLFFVFIGGAIELGDDVAGFDASPSGTISRMRVEPGFSSISAHPAATARPPRPRGRRARHRRPPWPPWLFFCVVESAVLGVTGRKGMRATTW